MSYFKPATTTPNQSPYFKQNPWWKPPVPSKEQVANVAMGMLDKAKDVAKIGWNTAYKPALNAAFGNIRPVGGTASPADLQKQVTPIVPVNPNVRPIDNAVYNQRMTKMHELAQQGKLREKPVVPQPQPTAPTPFNINDYVSKAKIIIDTNGQLRKWGNTLAIENNNPGNLRFAGQPGAVKGRSGFAKFPDIGTGFRALYMDVLSKQKPERNLTLQKMMEIYSPPSENNTSKYINTISSWLGTKPDAKVKDINTLNLAQAIAKFESQTSFID